MTDGDNREARRAVLDAAQTMSRSGLSPGRSGNVSMRWKDGMLITPSAMPYERMTPDDIVETDGAGAPHDPSQVPSSEWRFHLAVLDARPDCHAVVHGHALNATALACAGRDIPAFHYMVAVAGGDDIPLVPYALFGTETLARHVAEGLRARNACLMANHGLIAIGASPADALELAQDVEILSAQYVKVLRLGTPKILSAAAMRKVLARFSTYGKT